MKIKTYIKKCNMKQLAQFLQSAYWNELELDVVFGNHTIEEHAEYLYKVVFYLSNKLKLTFSFSNAISST